MIPNKYSELHLIKTREFLDLVGKVGTASHLVILRPLPAVKQAITSYAEKRQNIEIKPYCCQ